MKIRKHPGLIVSQKIVKRLERILTDEQKKILCISCYSNCREQGYAITSDKRRVCFAEYRNTDEAVLYMGRTNQFSTFGSIPNDLLFGNALFFKPGEKKAVARHIKSFFFKR